MLPATQHSLVEFSLLTLFLYIFTLCIYLFCPVLHNLLDKLLNVKQASDMPAVQKSRHRIDPDAIPSPVSFLCACLFLCFILSSPHACTNPQPPPPLPFLHLKFRDSHSMKDGLVLGITKHRLMVSHP